MNNFLLYLLVGLCCVVVQSTVLAYIGVGGLRIELLLIVVTFVALNHPLIFGSLLVSCLGYFYDLNSATPMGLHLLSFLTCFLALNLVRGRLYVQGPAFCIGLTAAMVVLHDVVMMVFLSSRGVRYWSGFSQIAILIPKALMTGAGWPILSPILKKIEQHFPPPFQPSKAQTSLQFK